MAFIFDCYFSSEECITPYKGIKITQVELAKLKEVMKGIIRLLVMRHKNGFSEIYQNMFLNIL